jgi:hypothetical protein
MRAYRIKRGLSDRWERQGLFATYADARRAIISQGATHASEPSNNRQIFFRLSVGFPNRWGECFLFLRSDGKWEISNWLLSDSGVGNAGNLPFVSGPVGHWPV